MYWEIKLTNGVKVYLYARNRIAVLMKFWDWGYIPDDMIHIRPLNLGPLQEL